jgi:hypothetical protein
MLFAGCRDTLNSVNSLKEVSVAIYNDGFLSNDVFLLNVKSSGEVKVSKGTRLTYEIDDPSFMKAVKTETVKLTEGQISNLTKTLNKAKIFSGTPNVVADGWEVILKIDNKIYNFTIDCAKDKNVNEYIRNLIKYLPLVTESIN